MSTFHEIYLKLLNDFWNENFKEIKAFEVLEFVDALRDYEKILSKWKIELGKKHCHLGS